MDIKALRRPDHPIDPLFLERWSPRAFTDEAILESYSIIAAIAIGRMGDKSLLPPPLQERESVSQRIPISQFAFEGRFDGS
jgi:hypothetical protein